MSSSFLLGGLNFTCFIFLIDFREKEEERKRERGKHQFVVPLIYAFIG